MYRRLSNLRMLHNQVAWSPLRGSLIKPPQVGQPTVRFLRRNRMEPRAVIFVCCVAALGAAQAFAQTKDNTAVCHTPAETKAATTPARLMEGYGKIQMPITTKSEEAQRFFNQGL